MKRKSGSVFSNTLTALLAVILLAVLFINLATLWSVRKIKNGAFIESGYYCVIIGSGSMRPGLLVNDLLVVMPAAAYQKGDVITYVSAQGYLVTHRIIEVSGEQYIAQGDANNIPDESIHRQRVLGKVIYAIPAVGGIIAGIISPLGITLLACAVLLIWLIGRVWRSIEDRPDEAPRAARQEAPAKNPQHAAQARRRKNGKKRYIIQLLSAVLAVCLLMFSLGLTQGTLARLAKTVLMSDSARAAVFDVVVTAPEAFWPEQGESTYEYYFLSAMDIQVLVFEVTNNGETDVRCRPYIDGGIVYRVYVAQVPCTEFVVRTNETVIFWLGIGSDGLDTNIRDVKFFIDIQQVEGR